MTVTVETKECNYHFSADSDSMGIRIQFEKKLDNDIRQITSYGTLFEDGNIALFSKWWMVENDYKNEQEFFEKHFQNKFNYEGFYYLCLRKRLGYVDSFEEITNGWILKCLSNKSYRENPAEEFIYEEMVEKHRQEKIFQG